MRVSIPLIGVLALILAGCERGHGERAKAGKVPFPVAFPDVECEPGPEAAEVDAFPTRIDLAPGETASIKVSATRNGYCGPIDVDIIGLPDGVTSEPISISWPGTVATIQMTAADVLTDDIRHVNVRTRTSQEQWFEFTLRTRASAEPDWSDEVVGIRHTRAIGPPTWFDGNRIVFSDYEWKTSPDELTPVIRCIEPGTGRCTNFGESGSISLEPIPYGGGAGLATEPDGSFVLWVSPPPWEPSPVTTWARLTPAGDVLPFPGIAAAATDTLIANMHIDASGRMLFMSRADGSPFSLLRLNPDGSLDDSFGDGGVLTGEGRHPIRVLPDGRIVLGGPSDLLWLQNDGTPTGPPIPATYCCAHEALDDGSVLYGHIEDSDTAYEVGSVKLVDSSGTLVRSWELGLQVEPLGLAIRGDQPDLLVVAQVGDGSGLLRLFRLPLDGEPILVAEGTIGSSVWDARISSTGPLVIVGDREFRLPDGGVGWEEAYVWRIE